MSKRESWEFSFSYGDLAKAAEEQYTEHIERADHWDGQLAELDKQLRASGVQYRDVPMTGGTRTDVVIDVNLKERLDEARRKRAEHERRAEEYAGYVRAFQLQLESDPQGHLLLTVDDIVFGL